MKALLIGGSGFIGSHVVDVLLKRGHKVRVYDRSPERFRQTRKGVEFQSGQLNDTAALAEALAGVDQVFHMASTTVPSTSDLDPIADIEGNLINMVRLLKLMREASVKRIIFLSSGGAVYGVTNTSVVPEDHALKPISSYGIVKVAIENYLHAEQQLHGLRSLVLRPANPYGPRQGRSGVQGVVGTFMRHVAQDQPLEIWGDGSVVRDFFHVADLARLCVDCAEADITGVFNAGSGTGHSIREIVDMIAKASGKDPVINYKPGRGFDVPKVVLDISAIKSRIGWSPEISLREGISETWDWLLAQPE
ncbi:NAD-dependent epimerase/dehydratase family protein [Primorskyibacter sp. S87]|uniref:NAD-dependent epimerase/dehydratase family protein n=1 Tax=Primorskyibacter sp. S87 TaxID=3415126 RepID=UPI003C7BA006